MFWAKGERVRTSAAYPLVLTVMRRRVPELQICDVGAEPGSTRCSTRASERCAMFDSWQIMSIWNMRCAQSQQRASHVSTTTRVCGLGAPDIDSCSCTSLRSCNEKRELCVALLFASEGRFLWFGAVAPRGRPIRHVVEPAIGVASFRM